MDVTLRAAIQRGAEPSAPPEPPGLDLVVVGQRGDELAHLLKAQDYPADVGLLHFFCDLLDCDPPAIIEPADTVQNESL